MNSKVFLKNKRINRSKKALVSMKARLKFMGRPNIHSRQAKVFEELYKTSPRRKIEKLKEARYFNKNSYIKSTFFSPYQSPVNRSEGFLRLFNHEGATVLKSISEKTRTKSKDSKAFKKSH